MAYFIRHASWDCQYTGIEENIYLQLKPSTASAVPFDANDGQGSDGPGGGNDDVSDGYSLNRRDSDLRRGQPEGNVLSGCNDVRLI